MKKRIFVYALIFSVLTSCTSDNAVQIKDGVTTISLLDIKEGSNGYKIQKIIPLETTPSNLMGMYLRVKMKDKEIFILDEDIKDAIHHFDMSGKYKGSIAQSGEGPGMVNNMYDFLIDKDTLEIITGKGSDSEIVKISLTDGGSRHLPLDLLGDSFEKLDNGNYIIYAGYNLPHASHRLVELSPKGEEVNRSFKNDYKNEMLPMVERNFQKVEGNIYFKEAFNPTTYLIAGGTIHPRVKFDFGRYQIPSRFWEINIMEGFEMINSTGFADIYQYFENDLYAFFEIYIQNNEGIQNHQVLMDKQNNSVSREIFSKNENSIFYQSVGFSPENELIFVAPAAFLKDYAEKADLGEGIKSQIDSLHKDDNPVLVYCKVN